MTHEQHQAREWISLYEGAGRLTCDMDGKTLVCETDTGRVYRVDPEGNHIRRESPRWDTDLVELIERVERPETFEADPSFDPEPPTPPLPYTDDFGWENQDDLLNDDRWFEDDCKWLVEQEMRFGYGY